jgi:hypothetical protein
MDLFAGGEVWAQNDSTALLNLVMDGLVRVAPNTVLTVLQPEAQTLQLNLDEGQIWINVDGLQPGQTFQVETPSAVISVRGTRFSVHVAPDGATTVSSLDGDLEVVTAQGSYTVMKYTSAAIAPDGSMTQDKFLSVEAQLNWGLSAGPGLEVAVPMGDLLARAAYSTTLSQLTWTGDSSRLRFRYLDKAIQTYRYAEYRLADQTFSPLVNFTPEVLSAAFSPYGAAIAWINPDGMDLCTLAGGAAAYTCFGAAEGYFDAPLVWGPGEAWVLHQLKLFDNSTSELKIYPNLYRSQADGKLGQQLTQITQEGRMLGYSWSPDGSQAAYIFQAKGDPAPKAQAWVLAADGSNPRLVLDGVYIGGNEWPPLWSPDGQWLALLAESGLTLVRPDGSETLAIPGAGAGNYYTLQWSPSPQGWPLLYRFYSQADKIGGSYLLSRADAAPLPINLQYAPLYAPNGRQVVFVANDVGPAGEPVSWLWLYQAMTWWWGP